jgi:hypothetical protein
VYILSNDIAMDLSMGAEMKTKTMLSRNSSFIFNSNNMAIRTPAPDPIDFPGNFILINKMGMTPLKTS